MPPAADTTVMEHTAGVRYLPPTTVWLPASTQPPAGWPIGLTLGREIILVHRSKQGPWRKWLSHRELPQVVYLYSTLCQCSHNHSQELPLNL